MKKLVVSILLCCLLYPIVYAQKSKEKTVNLAVISTDFGDITLYLYDETPKHKENFLKLVREGFYDSTTFHRVMKEFMIQGGDINSKDEDPNNDGQGSMGYTIPAEIMPEKYFHKRGALCAARMGDHVNPKKESSGSQFYIVQGRKYEDPELDRIEMHTQQMQIQMFGQQDFLQRESMRWLHEVDWQELQNNNPDSIRKISEKLQTDMEAEFNKKHEKFKFSKKARDTYKEVGGSPNLDNGYTVFGEVISGMDVVDKIASEEVKKLTEKGEASYPVKPIYMKARILTVNKEDLKKKYNYSVE